MLEFISKSQSTSLLSSEFHCTNCPNDQEALLVSIWENLIHSELFLCGTLLGPVTEKAVHTWWQEFCLLNQSHSLEPSNVFSCSASKTISAAIASVVNSFAHLP